MCIFCEYVENDTIHINLTTLDREGSNNVMKDCMSTPILRLGHSINHLCT